MDPTLLKTGAIILGLTVLVIAGALVIRYTRGRLLEDRPIRPDDLLAPLEEAYRRGQMDEAEYQRVRRSLEGGKVDAAGAGGKAEDQPPRPDRGETIPGA
jgi:hypothetical protein